METWNQLTDEEIKIGFVASCIESAAERLGCQYDEMLGRMEKVGLIDNYIYPHYEALHSEDRNNLTDNIIETLNRWEANNVVKNG
ncbi:MAG: DUF3791 domain-containing protein [Muribaculaceae bacterium]|nr:DUF3791 domain-containing protein [Muribaculaceae bacterium]MDE7155866.1 DUF3791 domain-containing protein [Muribaculaceae bacterium]MDE7369981.1 DUF3791 domain-containing protein [Muribaculaceae bacterium]